MKKNLLLGLMALAGLFTSCSKDDVSSLPTDQSNMVSMKVEMPADFAKTRAVPTAPADHKLRCILEVWDKDGTNLKVRQEQIYTSGSEMTFKFDLSDQAEYKAVLWADYIATDAATSSVTTPNAYTHYADKYYKTNDATGLKKVTIIESAYTYTEQLREVFTGVKSFTKTANAIEVPKVTLKRPLTKLTIAEKDATNFALCATVKATYNVPSEFNAFTETVEAATYAATYNAAPTGTNITISSAACKALFADYVFTASDATIGEISLEFTSTGADKLTSKVIPAGIPLKRNYQINAAGSLIVSEGNPNEVSMTVDMDNNWAGTENSEISEPTPAVGNFYYDDGSFSSSYSSTKTCIGIIFWVNPEDNASPKGKIVSLDEAQLAWSTETVAFTKDFVNASTVINAVKAITDWQSKYPAIAWCDQKGAGWYLPSRDELVTLCNNKAVIQTSLTACGGSAIHDNPAPEIPGGRADEYWTSSAKSSDNAYLVRPNDASFNDMPRTDELYVRAILAF